MLLADILELFENCEACIFCMQRCHERLANSRQSLLERFRWKTDSYSDHAGSARTMAIRDLVTSEWKAFKQEYRQQLATTAAADVNYFCMLHLQ